MFLSLSLALSKEQSFASPKKVRHFRTEDGWAADVALRAIELIPVKQLLENAETI